MVLKITVTLFYVMLLVWLAIPPEDNRLPMPPHDLQISGGLLKTHQSAAHKIESEPEYLNVPYTLDKKQVDCLIDNVYFEARNESVMGQLAVAIVTLHRVDSKRWPNDICSVVYQKRYRKEKWIGQFSWTVDGNSNIATDMKSYAKIQRIIGALIYPETGMYDFTLKSTHYHATYANPEMVKWTKKLTKTVQIGQHIFYR